MDNNNNNNNNSNNNNNTLNIRGAKTVPVKSINNKRKSTAIFPILISGELYKLEWFMKAKMKWCLSKYNFPAIFDISFLENYWSNIEKLFSLFKKIAFPNLKTVRHSIGCQDVIVSLCAYNNSAVVIVHHNLVNKF